MIYYVTLLILGMSTVLCAMRPLEGMRTHEKKIIPQRLIVPQLQESALYSGGTRLIAIIAIPTEQEHAKGEAHNTIALDLSKNNLSTLHTPFHYPELLEIDCSDNEFEQFPSQLCNCLNLKSIFLQGNRISRLIPALRNLHMLTQLDLSHNALKDIIEELYTLSQLTYLDVSHNALQSLSPSLKKLQKLTYINLTGNLLAACQIRAAQKTLPTTRFENA